MLSASSYNEARNTRLMRCRENQKDVGGRPFSSFHSPLPLKTALYYASEVVLGVRALHRFIHGDLKHQNILLGAENHLQIIDLGLASDFSSVQIDLAQYPLASYERAAIKLGQDYSYGGDIWSLGVGMRGWLVGAMPEFLIEEEEGRRSGGGSSGRSSVSLLITSSGTGTDSRRVAFLPAFVMNTSFSKYSSIPCFEGAYPFFLFPRYSAGIVGVVVEFLILLHFWQCILYKIETFSASKSAARISEILISFALSPLRCASFLTHLGGHGAALPDALP
ncbi:hypothetical protein FB45DRAFT_1039332 [Roridomyces roridus]|uniref:non-specific serine/threonine protein kinase n=1 Tax=Roridomyces roridus TaxID=1738132 RepID=A0AAD7FAD1_9AGAR|nr:hypothetical protein FB45DRAFT_1039332 [Roridomyces roridus]